MSIKAIIENFKSFQDYTTRLTERANITVFKESLRVRQTSVQEGTALERGGDHEWIGFAVDM
jgi:hypothetical protein